MDNLVERLRAAVEFAKGKEPDVTMDDDQIAVMFHGESRLSSWNFGATGKIVVSMATDDPATSFAFNVADALASQAALIAELQGEVERALRAITYPADTSIEPTGYGLRHDPDSVGYAAELLTRALKGGMNNGK